MCQKSVESDQNLWNLISTLELILFRQTPVLRQFDFIAMFGEITPY